MSEIGQDKAMKIVGREERQQQNNRPVDEADQKARADVEISLEAPIWYLELPQL